MTSVEKRRSGRKNGGHRKHSDGGYSDTSSCGSFLDETDREVSNLTDRAFRSLCIGDEAVYNDSDLGSSSPCVQRDRQLAFSQSGQDRERRDLKRAAHESVGLRMQQYGHDWIHRGMYGAEIQRDPQWEVYGERTQGRVSATFQHSFVETSEQGESLGEAELPILSNGEFSSQQRRSRSRVSSLIRAFNSEGQRDGAGMNDILRERNDETSWDKSALMSIQRELSELSTSYQQNSNSGHFPSAGSFSCQDTNIYSSEVAAVAHMNSSSSLMRGSHSKHSMSTQVNCNSNFFIHSEFSPFKVWRNHNRFPFQQGEVSGYMHCAEFPKWYETPMYREPQGPYWFEERGVRCPRNNLAPMVPPTLPRSTSTSTMLQKAPAVEKRCESELTGHYPHRKRTQSLGPNRLPSQRPSTASPTSEMSQRVQDTISSVKALQQKIKMMTEQNITTGMTANQQEVFCATDHFIPFSNDAKTAAPNFVGYNSSMAPHNMSQPITPLIHAQETEMSDVQQYAASPQPVEHPPVRAESRGATPDVRMSTYKSRATNLLFNLKDNRKRVKSTYSPAKFKGLEMEKNKEASTQQPRDTVIDIPEFPESDFFQVEDFSRTNAASYQHVNQYPCPGLLQPTNSQPVHAGQYSEYTDYHAALMQSEMVHQSVFTPGNYVSNQQTTNGQNLYEDSLSLTPYQQGMIHNTQGGDLYRLKSSYTATQTQRQHADKNQHREYLISKANAEQHFNETVGWEYTKVDKYQQLKDNKHDYSNVSSQDRWRKMNSKDADNLSVNACSPWKQEMTALLEKDQHAEAYQRAQLNSQRDRGENILKELPQNAPFSCDAWENPAYFGQSGQSVYAHQNYYGHNKESEMEHNYLTQRYNRYTDQENRNQLTVYNSRETGQKKEHSPISKVYEMPQPIEAKPQFEHNRNKNALSASTMENKVIDRQFTEVEAGQVMVDHIKAQHTQAALAKAQHWAQVEQPRPESARLILARQTDSEKGKAEIDLTDENRLNQNKTEHIKEEKKQEEQSREKQSEDSQVEWTKSEQTRVKRVTEEPQHIKEEAGAEHLRQDQGEPLKAKRPEAERLKEELINTEAAKTEQARLEQVKSEQVRRERVKAEQREEEEFRAKQNEMVKAEKADAEHKKAEQAKLDQIQAEQEKTKIAEVGKVKADQMQVEDVKQTKPEEDSGQVGRANAEQTTTQIRKAEERKGEQAKLEETKMDLAKAELTKPELTQAKSAKPKLTMTKQIKSEPDKVMQVKTELAKAKAELAKIKEKMREEQKEKDRNTVPTKEDGFKPEVVLELNKNEADKDQEQPTQIPQQREDSVVVSRQHPEQANITLRGIDEYERLREKYGFTDKNSQNRNCVSAAAQDSSNDANETARDTLDKVETKNNEKSKDKLSPTIQVLPANTENIEDISNFKHSGLTESQYVYSETSKEFKLSGNFLPKDTDKRANTDIVTDKMTNDSVKKFEKRTQQRDLDMAKPLLLEKKSKSIEHSVGPGRDQHISLPRALSHKERAQTKQEILTSKIKAHAEKEISAIKEKGFAVRDGVISKNSTKQLSGIQSNNVRQRPPSHDASKKHDSTISSKITPKHQMEPSGIQKVSKEPMKSDDNEPKPQKGAQHTDERWEDKKNEKQSEIRSPIQSNGQKKQEEQSAGENSGKQKERPKDNLVLITDHFNKKTVSPSEGTALVQTSKPMRTEKAESKHEDVHEDSGPLQSHVFGQNKTPVSDDSLQITGIMVTVRENKPSVDDDQRKGNSQINVKEKECRTSRTEQRPEASKGNILSEGVTIVKPKDGVDFNNHSENTQGNSTLNTSENNVFQTVSVSNNPQQDRSYTETRPQRVSQAQETEKGVPSSVTVLAKNKDKGLSDSTQPLLYKQDIMVETKDSTNETAQDNPSKSIRKYEAKRTEENSPQNRQTAHNNDKMANTTIRCTNDSYTADAKSLINQPSVKDLTTDINASKSRNIDDKSAPLVEEKRCGSTPPKPFNKTSTSNHLTENESTNVNPTHQDQEAHIGENNEVDDNVHIGSIAIRVVPSSKKDNLKMAETYQVTTAPSDGADNQKQVSSLSVEENVKTLNEDRTKDICPTSSDKQMKDGLAEECMLFRKLSDSPKIDNQQKSTNTTSEDTQENTEKPQEVNNCGKSTDDSKIQPMVEDYFQVQGMAETNNGLHRCTNVGLQSDVVSKGRGLPGSPLNEAAISDESGHERKHEAFVLDLSKRKTVEPSSARVQDEDMKRKVRETKESLVSKQKNAPTERRSNNNEKTEVGQAVRKQQRTENPSVLSRERQSSRNSHPTKENIRKEKAEVKPKSKERVNTIPEISAIADYARLKVIVSEDESNTSQEFPPSKKEGFFPLIQTRHSRRPVFTADPQEVSVKEKHLPNNTEVFSKVHKEPKPLVFPITEKEHQRTGMFKLGDKERQEKTPLGVKANENVLATAKPVQHQKEQKLPTSHLKNKGNEEWSGILNIRQEEQSINHPSKKTTTSVNRPKSNSASLQQKLPENPHEQLMVQVINTEENTALAKTGEERPGSNRVEGAQQQSSVEEKQTSRIEEERRAEQRAKHMIEETRASLAEEERRAAQREEERRAREREAIAVKIKERREKQRRAERRAEEERAAQKEEERIAKQREEDRRKTETEERRTKITKEEHRAQEEQQRRALQEEQQWKAVQEEQQRRAVQEEQQRKAVQEEQQRRAVQEEQQRKALQEEQQRRAVQEEQQRRAVQEEQQRRAVQEEQQRKAVQEEQQRKALQEEQQRRALQEEQQRRALQEEQQRRAVKEEQQRRAAQEEQRRAAEEKQLRRAAQEEEQRRAVKEEQQMKALQEEQRRAAQEQLRRAAQEEEQRRAAQEQQRALQEEQKRRAVQEEQRRALQEEKRRTAQEEQQRRATQEDQRRAVLIEEKRKAKHREEKVLSDIEEKKQRKQREEEKLSHISEEERIEEQKKAVREQKLSQREEVTRAKQREGDSHRGKMDAQMEEQRGATQRMDALQYYAITSAEPAQEPLTSQQRHNPSGLEESGSHRPHRPQAPASPAPSVSRSNTSSPALGVKPSMFRVKDNTFKGSSLTKSVKPRFHKTFGEDLRAGSPMERGFERGEEDQEIMRRSAGTPVYPDTALNRLALIKESSTYRPAYSTHDHKASLPQYRPYSRRSIALDEDDSRSIISNMSEDVESIAVSVADSADIRGLHDYERPESACSFSSDVSRSLGKPPSVPPKSEKALRRAQRLTTRRIKKELSKVGTDSPAGVQEVSSGPSSSSTEVRSSSHQAVASPHFSPPVSLAHAPTLGSSLPSSHPESSHSSFSVSPHVTGPISLPVASPHATAPISLPVASLNVTGSASHTVAPMTVAHVPSSPTLHHATHPAPVTQYHVESSYPHTYPLTQRKVLQDLGSGQYFVVDVPVQVKTKTFIDPETGKYVQLNVRESGQSTSRLHPQQTYPQSQLQQPQPTPASNSFGLYQGNHGYPQDYQPQAINSVPCNSSATPSTPHQGQQPARESHSYGHPAPETGQNSEVHRYSPEKTPYMDTFNDKEKTYNTHGPYESLQCDTNSQLAKSPVCENVNSAHSQCQPRDIITMSELDDFMEVSDW